MAILEINRHLVLLTQESAARERFPCVSIAAGRLPPGRTRCPPWSEKCLTEG
jgi:hypothetical protein